MWELTPENATEYLRDHGWLPRDVEAHVQALAWGVSNVVLRVAPTSGVDFVLKQSRERLRTATPWFSRLDRIYREIDVLKTLATILPRGLVPQVLFEDRQNFLFGMEAAPARHVVWKERLLTGTINLGVARRLGELLGQVHRETALREDLRQLFGDTEVFHQLRLHPFYESLAQKFPDASEPLQRLIAETSSTAACLVLADFSPKNVLLTDHPTGESPGLMLVDFETGHYGDPAFDLGFFLSHLLLKSLHQPIEQFEPFVRMTTEFLDRYWSVLDPDQWPAEFSRPELQRRMWSHLAGCLWARIDGTSPVDYLPESELRQVVREISRSLFFDPPRDWSLLLERLQNMLQSRDSRSGSNTTGFTT